MVSRKIICAISIAILCITVLCSCGKSNNPIAAAPNTEVSDKYSTTEAHVTAGKIEKSERIGTNDKDYEIAYYDVEGKDAKLEHYRDGKLRYYYVCSAFDDENQCIQQKYYNRKNKLLATYDSGYFFDAEGKQITEDMMDLILDKVE